MKRLTIVSSLLLFLLSLATAGAEGGGPASQTLDAQIRAKLSPVVRDWVQAEADKLRHSDNPEATATTDLRTRFQGQSLSAADHNRLMFLLFFDALQAADRELNNFVAQLKAGGESVAPTVAPPTISPTLQVGPSTQVPQSGPYRSGRLVAQPGPSATGATALSPGSLTMSPGTATSSAAPNTPPGAVAVTPSQAQQFQMMNNVRNHLVVVLNNVARQISFESDSSLQQLK